MRSCLGRARGFGQWEAAKSVAIGDEMRVLLEFPTVEYIPLDIITVARGDAPAADGSSNLLVAMSPEDMAGWPIPPEEVTFEDEVVLLGLGLELRGCAYRGHKVSILGRLTPGRFHLARMSSVYFYKNYLVFVVYDLDREVIGITETPLTRRGKS